MVKNRKIYTTASGVTFGNRQKALMKLKNYMTAKADIKTTLVRDYQNEFDKNAIKVMVSVNGSEPYQLGFIPRDKAHIIAPIIDKVGEVKVHMYNIVGGYDYNYGAKFVMWLPNE